MVGNEFAYGVFFYSDGMRAFKNVLEMNVVQ